MSLSMDSLRVPVLGLGHVHAQRPQLPVYAALPWTPHFEARRANPFTPLPSRLELPTLPGGSSRTPPRSMNAAAAETGAPRPTGAALERTAPAAAELLHGLALEGQDSDSDSDSGSVSGGDSSAEGEGDGGGDVRPAMSKKELRKLRNQMRLQYLDPEAVQKRREAAEDMIMDAMIPKRRTPAAAPKRTTTKKKSVAKEGQTGAEGQHERPLEAEAKMEGGGEGEGAEEEQAESAGTLSPHSVPGTGDVKDAEGEGLEGEAEREEATEEGEGEGGSDAREAEAATAGNVPRSLSDPIARLTKLGVRWWGLSAVSSMEFQVQAAIEEAFLTTFPEGGTQVFVPYSPTTRSSVKNLHGQAVKRVTPGAVYVRCAMNRPVYECLRDIEGVQGFVGHQEKHGTVKITVPWSIPEVEIESLRAVAQKQLELQEQAQQARRAKAAASRQTRGAGAGTLPASPDRTKKMASIRPTRAAEAGLAVGERRAAKSSKGGEGGSTRRSKGASASAKEVVPARPRAVRKGAAVRISQGPYTNLSGKVLSVDKASKQARVGLTLLGRTVAISVALDQLVVSQPSEEKEPSL